MSEKPTPPGKMTKGKVIIAGVAGLAATPTPAGEVVRDIGASAVREGVGVAAAAVEGAVPTTVEASKNNPSEAAEFRSPTSEVNPFPPDSPWLNRFSVEQDQIIENFNSLTPEKKEFVRMVIPAIRQVMSEKPHINPYVLFAQIMIETGWGESEPVYEVSPGQFAKSNNVLGIKANDSWPGKRSTRTATTERDEEGNLKPFLDYFRVYEAEPGASEYDARRQGIEAAIRDYVLVIENNSWFQDAEEAYQDDEQYAWKLVDQDEHFINSEGKRELERVYATDGPNYPPKLLSIVKNYQVHKLIDLPQEEFKP